MWVTATEDQLVHDRSFVGAYDDVVNFPDFFGSDRKVGINVGMFGGYLVGVKLLGVNEGAYIGRTITAITFTDMGAESFPKERLEIFANGNVIVIDDLFFILDILLSVKQNIPSFERNTEYISVYSDDEYGLYEGSVKSSDTGLHKVDDYESLTNEFVVKHSTSKHSKHPHHPQ